MYKEDWVDVSLRNNMPMTQYVKLGLRPDRTKTSKKYMVGHGDKAHVEYSSFRIVCDMLYHLLICFLNIRYM
jgi:hypothetical protein